MSVKIGCKVVKMKSRLAVVLALVLSLGLGIWIGNQIPKWSVDRVLVDELQDVVVSYYDARNFAAATGDTSILSEVLTGERLEREIAAIEARPQNPDSYISYQLEMKRFHVLYVGTNIASVRIRGALYSGTLSQGETRQLAFYSYVDQRCSIVRIERDGSWKLLGCTDLLPAWYSW